MKSTTMDSRLTIKAEHVYWRDVEIEHVNCDRHEDYDWDHLIQRCLHLESLGIEPRSSTVIWHWDWFDTMPFDALYRDLLLHTPGFWEHGCTPERAKRMAQANCRPPKAEEPDGSIAVSHHGKVVVWDGIKCLPLRYDETLEEEQGFYHAMRALRFHPAQMGQPIVNGPCYATYDMVANWLDQHEVNIGGMLSILRALDLDS